jgi:hypothetical protein
MAQPCLAKAAKHICHLLSDFGKVGWLTATESEIGTADIWHQENKLIYLGTIFIWKIEKMITLLLLHAPGGTKVEIEKLKIKIFLEMWKLLYN